MESFLKSNHAAQQTLEEKGQTYLFLHYELQVCVLSRMHVTVAWAYTVMIYVGVRHCFAPIRAGFCSAESLGRDSAHPLPNDSAPLAFEHGQY